MSLLCFFAHKWVHYKKQKGSAIYSGETLSLTYFQFRKCSRCDKTQELLNPNFNFIYRRIDGEWVDIDVSDLVADKV